MARAMGIIRQRGWEMSDTQRLQTEPIKLTQAQQELDESGHDVGREDKK